MSHPLTRKGLVIRAVPIMGANLAAPLVGLADLAVIGNTGDTPAIAAVALGTLVFNAFYWSLGFLRMGTTALAAQADGGAVKGEVAAVLWRAMAVGAGLGLLLVVFQWPLRELAFMAFSGDAPTEALGKAYVDARIWGAPAALAGFALYGWLIGMGLTGRALILQIALNLTNVILSLVFVLGFDWGVQGVAAASALAQWLHLGLAVFILLPLLQQRGQPTRPQLLDRSAAISLFKVNRDIFIRTLALLGGFYWFNEANLREGPEVLAGAAILLQFISITAFFLDAFANVAEAETGRAAGAKDWPTLTRAFRLTSELAAGASILLGLSIYLFGETFIGWMTRDAATQAAAGAALIWCALVPVVGWPSFQLDGLMIGTTRGRLMRNAMIASLAIYLALDFVLRPAFGVDGLWIAFLMYYVARAVTLALGWPGLRRDFA